MEESEVQKSEDIQSKPFLPFEPQVRAVLLVQIGLFILGAGLGGILFQGICLLMGWDPYLSLGPESPAPERWQVRIQLGLGHLFAFCVSGGLTVWFFYRSLTGVRPDWQDYLKIRKAPGLKISGLAILLMTVAIPLVLYTLSINKLMPLPEMFKIVEAQTEQIIRGLLQMDHFGEFLANLTIIAILPAIGEELVFRGVVQQQLMRKIANPMVAISVSAIIFSVAHFQFEGLIPRILLGLLLGYLYWKTKNLWVPIIAHFFNNGMQVFGQYLYGREISSIDFEQDVTVPWEFAVISGFMILVVIRLIRQTQAAAET